MLPHIIPFFRVLAEGDKIFEIPGRETVDIIADAIMAFLENCRRFMVYLFEKFISTV
jgi:hypothetical protein